jgi:putative lipoic acid-binding regulatory protein
VNTTFNDLNGEVDESIFNFPCDFPIKAMGKQSEQFEGTVVSIVRKHCPDIGENSVKTRASSGGKYISVTVTVRATSKLQLDNLYRELTALEEVLWAL